MGASWQDSFEPDRKSHHDFHQGSWDQGSPQYQGLGDFHRIEAVPDEPHLAPPSPHPIPPKLSPPHVTRPHTALPRDSPPRFSRVAPASLLTLLQTGQYSDLVIMIGTGSEAREYHLHQNIVCTRSRYLSNLCSRISEGTKPLRIALPGIIPPIFDIIVEWIYGEAFVLRHHQALILAIYKAADQLFLTSFKRQIARQVAKLLKDRRRHGEKIAFTPFDVVRGMFDHYHAEAGVNNYQETEWTSLRKCTDELALAYNIPFTMIHDEKRGGAEIIKPESKFWFAMALSYQKALDATVCGRCRDDVSTKRRLDRMCCHCDSSSSESEDFKERKPTAQKSSKMAGNVKPTNAKLSKG